MAFEGGFRLFREVFLFETVKLLTIWYCFKETVNKTENMIDKYPMGVYYMHVQDTLRGYIDRSSATMQVFYKGYTKPAGQSVL